MSDITLDMMEYSSNALAQAAYVTDDTTEFIDQQQTAYDATNTPLGTTSGGVRYNPICQSFKLSTTLTVTKVDAYFGAGNNSPTGQVTLKIYTDNSGEPGSIVDVNATKAITISTNAWNTFTFPASFVLTGGTTYWLRFSCDTQASNTYFSMGYIYISTPYPDGKYDRYEDDVWNGTITGIDLSFKIYAKGYLQCFSESTIKTQGSYSLKGVATITNSLNKTLTRTIGSPIDLTGVTQIKFDEYASRTGANIKVGIRNLISNADIDDEDMADITDWTDGDSGTGDSSQVTFDGKSCMKLYTGITNGGQAYRYQDIGSFGTRTVFSYNMYIDTIGTLADVNRLIIEHSDGTTRLYVVWASDGLFINDGASNIEVGTNLVVQDVWQEWTFDVNWTAKTVDVYLDGILKASAVDCSCASTDPNGLIQIYLKSTTVANLISYIDWFKAGSDFKLIEKTHSISNANTWETVTWDISGVADVNKDAIDKIIVTIVNADT